MKIKLKGGKKYSFCSCGYSRSLPYCDNAHRELYAISGVEYKSMKFTSEKDTIIEISSNLWKSIKDKK